MNDIELQQLVGKSEEQIIQGAFAELRTKITPQPKGLNTILTKLNQISPVNVTPSPYARYIHGWTTGMVKKGIGSVCAAALIVGLWYGFNSYNRSQNTEESSEPVADNVAITGNTYSFDSEDESYFMADDADEAKVLAGIMESDVESISSFNSFYNDEETQ